MRSVTRDLPAVRPAVAVSAATAAATTVAASDNPIRRAAASLSGPLLPPTAAPHQRRRPVRRLVKQRDSSDAAKKSHNNKKKRGWGPYGTIVNERAVAFNLALDVQQLKQEIYSLTVARDILLATRTLNQCDDPHGSLVRSVQAYYEIIRTGITLESPDVGDKRPRRAAYSQDEQRAFLDTFVDADIDFGGGLVGVAVMFEQLQRYSVFLKFISLDLATFEIVRADDTVVITTAGYLHFQILRSTIAGVFPHILGCEWLVSKLVGREVRTTPTLTFYFNERDRVCKYVVDLDFCTAFAELLADPAEVDMLFGRALIGDNCMFAASIADVALAADDGAAEQQQLALYQPSYNVQSETPRADRYEPHDSDSGVYAVACSNSSTQSPELRSVALDAGTQQQQQHQSESYAIPTHDDLNAIVRRYFDVFARVAHLRSFGVLSDEQRAFIAHSVAPACEFNDADSDADAAAAVGRDALAQRWCDLAACFDVLAFVQMAQAPLVVQPHEDLCFVRATGEYALRVTAQTIERVLPHVLGDVLIVDALLDAVLYVPTTLKFWLDCNSGRVECLKEAMDFGSAFAQRVPHPEDLAYVLAHARLTMRVDALDVALLHEDVLDAAAIANATGQESAACAHDRSR